MTKFYIDIEDNSDDGDMKKQGLLIALRNNFGIEIRRVVSVETDNPALTPLLEAIAEYSHNVSRGPAIAQTLEEVGNLKDTSTFEEQLAELREQKAQGLPIPTMIVDTREPVPAPIVFVEDLLAVEAAGLTEPDDEPEPGEILPVETQAQIALPPGIKSSRKDSNGHKDFRPGVKVITDELPADVVRHISQGGAIRGKKL